MLQTERDERRECDVREHEQRFGKTLDEDVKIGVVLALEPSQVQNRCHLNSHILKSGAQVRAMLFDNCRAQADTAAGDVVPMAKARKAKAAKTRRIKTKTRKAKAKARPIPKRPSTFLDTVLFAMPGRMR